MKKGQINCFFGVLAGLFLVLSVFAQDTTGNRKVEIPDYSKWELKVYPLDLDDDGKSDLTVMVYNHITDNESGYVQVWYDKGGRERTLSVTLIKRSKDGTLMSERFNGFTKIRDEWVNINDQARQEEITTATKLYIDNLGGPDNFMKALKKFVGQLMTEIELPIRP